METNTDPSKIVVCAFHMYNRQVDQELLVQFNGAAVNHSFSFKYRGVTTNRSLTFKKYLENFQKKVRLKINLLQTLADTGWRSNAHTIITVS